MGQRDYAFLARLDDAFLARLSELSGPLTPHQTRLVLSILLELLRLQELDIRRVTDGFFSKFWNTTYLTDMDMREFEQIAKKARQPIRRGRPPVPQDQLRATYNGLVEWAHQLRSTNPSTNEFRRALGRAQEAGG
jgi:hypothetical protein